MRTSLAPHVMPFIPPFILAALTFLGAVVVLSPSSSAILASLVVVASAPWARRPRRPRVALGVGVLLATVVLHVAVGRRGERLTIDPVARAQPRAGSAARYETYLLSRPMSGLDADAARVAASLVEERDLTLAGAVALTSTGLLPRSDARDLVSTMNRAYARMRSEEGTTPSPLALTLVGVGSTLVVEPASAAPRDDLAVVFLHGYGGSFSVQCWHVARAMRPLHARTYCPSVGFEGAWWTPRGDATLTATLAHLSSEGTDRVVLVGLSAGARGAAVLAARHADSLAAVVVISGGHATPPPRHIPVLALTGDADTMFPARHARRYARAAGSRGTLVTLEGGGHFVFLERFDEVERAIGVWLDATEL